MCSNSDIKELLPAYRKQGLDRDQGLWVEKHLETCADCRAELALLRVMAEEPVPDPGEVFWKAMPERVYRAVQEEKARPRLDLSGLLRRLVLLRWSLAAAAVGIVLTVSWLMMHQAPKETLAPAPSGEEYASEDVSQSDPVLRHTSVTIAELTSPELDAVDAWAAAELSSLAKEAGTNAANVFDTDPEEELSELNAREVDRLATMLKDTEKEG